MFFSQSLGPELNYEMSLALDEHLKKRFAGRQQIPFDELRAATGEYLKTLKFYGPPNHALEVLINARRIVLEGAPDGTYTARLQDAQPPQRRAG